MPNNFEKLHDDADLGTYDADGLPLYAYVEGDAEQIEVSAGQERKIRSGITVDLDSGYVAWIRPCNECLENSYLDVKAPPDAFGPTDYPADLGYTVVNTAPNPTTSPQAHTETIFEGDKIGTVYIQQIETAT